MLQKLAKVCKTCTNLQRHYHNVLLLQTIRSRHVVVRSDGVTRAKVKTISIRNSKT